MSTNIEEFNSDELEAPAWMDAEFLTKVICNCEAISSELKVKNFTISPATKKGDHYASVMFRVNLEYSNAGVDKNKSLIIKVMPEVDGFKKDMLGETNIFETEIGMYTKVVPRFEQILREAGDETVFKANCVYHQLSPRKLLVFEDIVQQGYDVVHDRFVLNDEELRAVLIRLAKWHAISYKIFKEEPSFFDDFRGNMFTMSAMTNMPFFTEGMQNFITAYKSHPKIGKYVPYFEKIQPQYVKRYQECFSECRESPQPNGCYVLCHGDLNPKNMMFKCDVSSGKLEDVKLIDFQMCYVGPNVLDLINAKFFLVDPNMRENWSTYLRFYLSQFKETLEKIGFRRPLPTMMRIRELIMRHKYYEYFAMMTFLPMKYSMEAGNLDLTEMATSADFGQNVLKNKKLIAELERLLPKYEELGYFDD